MPYAVAHLSARPRAKRHVPCVHPGLHWHDGTRERRHAPDFFVRRADGSGASACFVQERQLQVDPVVLPALPFLLRLLATQEQGLLDLGEPGQHLRLDLQHRVADAGSSALAG